MKECSSRKVLILRMSWDDPPNKANKLPGGQQDQGHEVVLQDQGEGYRLLGIGMAQYLRVSRRIPYSF